MPKEKLTDQICKHAAPPARGNRLYRCGETKGFALRVTKQGRRSFVFNYRNYRQIERRLTIGPYPDWSVSAARKRATELRRLVDAGCDPLEERRAERAAETLADLWEWYSASALTALAPSTQADIRYVWSRMILPILGAKTRLKDLHRRDVQAMVDRTTIEHGPYVANRAHSHLRRPLNLAVAEGWLDRNVATMAIRRNVEHGRERFLTREELVRLIEALDALGTTPALCLRFIALTGCRRGEALSARWEDVNIARRVWSKPAARTKTRRPHVVPLNEGALETLVRVGEVAPSATWIFPGRVHGQCLVELKSTWAKIRRETGLEGVRIHDLRHTFASFVALNGGTLHVAGALLGHTQVATTARYTHLFDDVLREAAEAVSRTVREERARSSVLS